MKQEDTTEEQQQLDHMEIICASLLADNYASISLLNFYRLNALPDAQPTLSKH